MQNKTVNIFTQTRILCKLVCKRKFLNNYIYIVTINVFGGIDVAIINWFV